MKPATKRIASFFFLLLGFTPLLFVLFITFKKQDIRHRMREKMERQSLQTVVLPENEVIWMDKHEIWVNEQMFDINSKKLENGVYTFTGLYDEEETILVKQESEAAGESAQENKLLNQLFECLQDIFYNELHENTSLICDQATLNNLLSPETISPFTEILTPPPQRLMMI